MIFEKLLGITTALAEEAGSAAAAAGNAAADGAAAVEQVNPVAALVTTFLPMVLIFVVFYFMLIRPQRKKDKKVKEMLNNLKAGDRVCTIGGIYGTIIGIKDDTVTLSVGRDNMSMVIARWGIRSVEEVTIENDAEALN
ncbi:MAG: preprotein translocase subunit YajC [Clostridia bacterium]|nr:preprotein translocase subunit YajC [Clostridia bacterium]MBR0386836.1 preprotein translocase subunit YajC [Clostridia bacterium]MBR2601500.1 preprotein translocase subunit YajC [Clostridia bacterium]MBR2664603.1 preprotein translocase subunit YajC [Clostridia bacterium]MBR7172979.1 preprotein translocase subunit YajC [Clostridia bacterium]